MGFLKGAANVILSVLLFLSLLAGGVCLTLGMSLKYENVQPLAINISSSVISQDISLNDSVIESINNSYYKDYNCTFIKCIEEGEITSLISEKARNYWISKFYMFLVISIAFIVLLFLLTDTISSWLFLVGSLLVIDSLIISKINIFGGWIAKILLTSIEEIFSGDTSQTIISQIVNLFFVESRTVFYLMLGIGIALLVLGFIFYLFKIGFKINSFIEKIKGEHKEDVENLKEESISKKEVKDIVKDAKEDVKEEVKKEVKAEIKQEIKEEIISKKPKQKNISKKKVSSY